MDGLSLAVRLGELNDFLEPSQDCAVELVERADLIKEDVKAKAATVSLTDCLACSGCVTTAETVLMSTHNHQALVDALEGGAAVVVISISGVAEAALMALYRLPTRGHFYAAIKQSLDQRGNLYGVYSFDLAESLLQTAAARGGGGGEAGRIDGRKVSAHCPGSVLFAEKLEQDMLPYIDTLPPSQVWQGLIVRHLLPVRPARTLPGSVIPSAKLAFPNVLHVTVNTCADKKLEMVRPEFEGLVDLSLSADELLKVLEHYHGPRGLQYDGKSAAPWKWDLCHLFGAEVRPAPWSEARASGWMVADYVEKHGQNARKGHNADHHVYGGEVSAASGLRNMKNLFKKPPTTQLEVVACPKGCFNGPGLAYVYSQDERCKEAAKAIYKTVERWVCRSPSALLDFLHALRGGDFGYRLKPIQTTGVRNNW